MKYTIERLTEDDVDNFNLTEEEAKNLRVAVRSYKNQMTNRSWKRPDKVVSTIVIGKPGTEVIPNDFKSWLNPRLWLSKLMLAVHYFLYRHVAFINNRAWVTIHILKVPMYKRLVEFATDKKKRIARTEADKKMIKDRILSNIQNLKKEIGQIPDEKRKNMLMDVIDDALKKNSNS